MSAPAKIPLFATLKLALQWGTFVILTHWKLVLASIFIEYVCLFGIKLFIYGLEPNESNFILSFVLVDVGSFLAFGLAYVYLILITHNEVLVGPAGFNRSTVGPMGLRAFGYLFDVCVAMMFVFVVFVLYVIALILVELVNKIFPSFRILFSLLTVFSFFIVIFLVFSRLLLRLPSRAIGQPLKWIDVWDMGKGNSWRLFGGQFLLLLMIAVPIVLIEFPISLFVLPVPLPAEVVNSKGSLAGIPYYTQIIKSTTAENLNTFQLMVKYLIGALNVCIATFQVVVITAFLSLAYAQLRKNLEIARAARQDPNRPPWEYDDDYR